VAARLTNIAKWIILAPFVVLMAAVALPVVFLLFVGRFLGSLWHVSRLRASWPSTKFVLIAYTDSALWAPYIENELLPQIEEHCVVVNRSRENWKREFRAERAALSFWGGWRAYNPIAVVLRPWGQVRVFRFYDPFKQLKQGQPASLEDMAGQLVRCVRKLQMLAPNQSLERT
jgi:hypothetical protein